MLKLKTKKQWLHELQQNIIGWNTRPVLILANIIAEQLKTHLIHADIKPRPFAPKANQVHHCIIEDENQYELWLERQNVKKGGGEVVTNYYDLMTINCNISLLEVKRWNIVNEWLF